MRYDTYMKSMLQSLIEKRSKILNESVVVRNRGLIGHWNVARPMNAPAHHIIISQGGRTADIINPGEQTSPSVAIDKHAD